MTAELVICILSSEGPLYGFAESVSRLLQRIDLRAQQLPAWNAAVQALAAEDTDLDFGHVEPALVLGRVVELHPAQQLGGSALAQHVVEAL